MTTSVEPHPPLTWLTDLLMNVEDAAVDYVTVPTMPNKQRLRDARQELVRAVAERTQG